MSDNLNRCILDQLIPGDENGWPAAGQLDLYESFILLLERLSDHGLIHLNTVTDNLPTDFCLLSNLEQTQHLTAVEKDYPEAFQMLIKAAYSAYYTDVRVRLILERKTGYEARPPQPLGYDLPVFDETLLDPVRERGPIWRRVP
jgi:hypothetical protein